MLNHVKHIETHRVDQGAIKQQEDEVSKQTWGGAVLVIYIGSCGYIVGMYHLIVTKVIPQLNYHEHQTYCHHTICEDKHRQAL